MRLSFRAQAWLSLAVLACLFTLGRLFKMGVLHNTGWVLVGLLFLVHPVWPRSADWRDHAALKKGVRTGSALVIILFGFLCRYGV